MGDIEYKEKFLKRVIQNEGLVKKDEDIILSAGGNSKYYFDIKKLVMMRTLRPMFADLIWEKIKDKNITAIGGLESGAIPIVDLMIDFYFKINHGFYVRKERKKHGLMKTIEGILLEDDRICIVDDVTTSGDTIIKCIEAVEQMKKGKIIKVLVIVDRLEGAKDKIAKYGYVLENIFTKDDFEIE